METVEKSAVESELTQLVLSNMSFGPQEIAQIIQAISGDFSNYRVMRDAVAELEVREQRTPATAVRLGVCYYLMGRYEAAIRTLEEGDRGALTLFYLGKSNLALGDYEKAKECYSAAASAGYDRDTTTLAIAEALRH
ncbi:MAG: tetratricopeptide repeat protein, partial [Planctomycetales bacterium]|nr:tetratricopeptide repeat protein [Planctomycetales bacterium]NIM08644.1 tetratricopeptide repeat protein [Planctomycetales bacterium]NIN08112.1 tetratricopeptide repeat protein [Planctomycetales bacterium]NIN77237.1 tetratricopeptide repeat protein [Planctomycetales bacterium]NIO34426.1 tetratricopeptide repeat protein [Planctomycetales bacterium]